MTTLFEKHLRKINATPMRFTRSIMDTIHWEARLIGIKGARGVGKTTLLLQYIKKNLPLDTATLYVSLDSIWFTENTLSALADQFVKQGGNYLFLDEVHKYPNWSQELKNIYDDYPELKIVFTASSLLEILNARADLSRRAVVYTMQGLSYREYINLILGLDLPKYTLTEILDQHVSIASEINKKIKPLQYFNDYLHHGYYPFFQEVPELYFYRIEEVLNLILEIELPLLRKVEVAYIAKLRQLLQIISQSVPFVPNVSKLSERIGVNRNTFVSYLYFLEEAHITRNLYKDVKGITQLQKPNKIYLENTNLQYALSPDQANIGNIRETFFLNQVSVQHKLEYIDESDFLVDHQFIFEVGGKSKNDKQIKNIKQSYLALDDLEYGIANKIPLWLFGFLY
ncbi:ATP-binding protein [Flavobacterium sp.]|uniref:ATP-binding protein n=1 Tax=Flavobacterium sp. TaxID=239 RepID=UPI003BCEEA41